MTRASSPQRLPTILATIALCLSALSLFVAVSRNKSQSGTAETSTLQRVIASHTLRVGYEGYPPYTVKDPTTGKLSGFSVELAEYIGREAGWKVEWIQTSADTKIPDLQARRFDVMTEPIFRTIPRAAQVSFSRAYAYFGDGAGTVRKGEKRFKTPDDLNTKGVTIAVRQGYTDQTFAADNFPLATLRVVKVDDISQLFLEVITKKADIALSDLEQTKAFAAKHKSEVETRFTDPAPSYIPAGLMLRQGDFSFYNFLNTSLDYMEANGLFSRLNKKFEISPGLPPSMH